MMEPFLINPPKRVKTIKRRRSRRTNTNPGIEELALLNPPRRKKMAVKRRSRNRKGQFTKASRRRKTTRRRRSTVARVIRRRSPARRRSVARRRRTARVHTLRRHSVYITNPRRRRSRRNPPLGLSMSSIVPTLKQGAFIALGAAAVSHAMARLPFVKDQVGVMRHVARLGVAVIGGTVLARFIGRDLGKAFAMGGVITTIMALGQEQFPAVFTPVSGDMALGMYYAEPGVAGALGEYYSSGPAVAAQPDGLSWDSDMPGRLDPASRY